MVVAWIIGVPQAHCVALDSPLTILRLSLGFCQMEIMIVERLKEASPQHAVSVTWA